MQGDRRVGERSDVYALGAILFELLALTPLHTGSTVEALVASTMTLASAAPSARAPELRIPPELDSICIKATALAPADRYASTREMQEAIERYLDGERDAERRSDLAKAHAAAAAEAFAAAAKAGPKGEPDRVRGLRELGAALALEPSNEETLQTLMRVLIEPTGDLPPQAEAELDALQAAIARGARGTRCGPTRSWRSAARCC